MIWQKFLIPASPLTYFQMKGKLINFYQKLMGITWWLSSWVTLKKGSEKIKRFLSQENLYFKYQMTLNPANCEQLLTNLPRSISLPFTEPFVYFSTTHHLKWNKLFKNGPSKICGRQPLKNLKGYGPVTNFPWK